MTVYCATTNEGKLREFRLAASAGLRIDPLPQLRSLPAPEETGATFEENAIQKALWYGPNSDGLLFVEDSGLEVDALGGEPGVYSARYSGPNATDELNNQRVLERLAQNPDRAARFVSVIALVSGRELLRSFRGTVEGRILHEPRGVNGFGYDPIFYYEPFGCSFGEVDGERKQQVSHRGSALRQLVKWLTRDQPR